MFSFDLRFQIAGGLTLLVIHCALRLGWVMLEWDGLVMHSEIASGTGDFLDLEIELGWVGLEIWLSWSGPEWEFG